MSPVFIRNQPGAANALVMGAPARPSFGERLNDVLTEEGDFHSVRWRVEVPVVTNPFILSDFLRFSLIMAAVIFAMTIVPEWLYTGRITETQLLAILRLCGLGFSVYCGCLFAVGFLLLRNRFQATFVLSPSGIYYETARCKGAPSLKLRPAPADEKSRPRRAFSRDIPWRKADSFVGFPSMRTILLKRGLWEILKIYAPDDEAYAKAQTFLCSRLRQRAP